ncbi:hypothetical protein WJX73_002427 [Symbiochloris irregularis]|uniref:S-acyltransferase n=1 Tax=Symbiochloris irregularis TaxID=706552 RepID=A0AAW1NPH9_9CHLO
MPAPNAGSPRRRGDNTGLHYAFCNGRFTVGPDWKSVLGSLFLILAPAGIYFGFIARDNGIEQSWAVPVIIAVLVVASVALLMTTAIMDPGFVPRNMDPKDMELGDRPPSKEHQINGYTVNTKWCTTCNHYRPPRCSHCAICDNCTRKFDHHCPWVGNCIGERNYRFFFAFLVVTTALDLLVHAFCWVRLATITHQPNTPSVNGQVTYPNFGKAIQREPAAIVLIAYTFLAFGFVGGLGSLHTFFISRNKTTYEHFRSRHGSSGNPYNRGCLANWAEVFCVRVAPRYTAQSKDLVELQQVGTNGRAGELEHMDGSPGSVTGAYLSSDGLQHRSPELDVIESAPDAYSATRGGGGTHYPGHTGMYGDANMDQPPRGTNGSRHMTSRTITMEEEAAMRRTALRSTSGVSIDGITESSAGHASSFDEEVFSAHRAVPDSAQPLPRLHVASSSDFSAEGEGGASDEFTQATDDDTVQYEPRLDSGDLRGSGSDPQLEPDLALAPLRLSGSDDSEVQTVPFEPQLNLPDQGLQEQWNRQQERVAPSGHTSTGFSGYSDDRQGDTGSSMGIGPEPSHAKQ